MACHVRHISASEGIGHSFRLDARGAEHCHDFVAAFSRTCTVELEEEPRPRDPGHRKQGVNEQGIGAD
jgi:hypothetical protein